MQYTLNFSIEEMRLLQMALGELPLKVSAILFSKLQSEVIAQDKIKDELPVAG